MHLPKGKDDVPIADREVTGGFGDLLVKRAIAIELQRDVAAACGVRRYENGCVSTRTEDVFDEVSLADLPTDHSPRVVHVCKPTHMSDGAVVLGLASRGDKDRLSIWIVEVGVDEGGASAIRVREPWQGTKGRDDASQLCDANAAIANALDAPALGARIEGVAVKRTEVGRGRPSTPYDRRIRFEAAAMLAALGKGRLYSAYRTNQLRPGAALAERVLRLSDAPGGDEDREAVSAACVALCDLT